MIPSFNGIKSCSGPTGKNSEGDGVPPTFLAVADGRGHFDRSDGVGERQHVAVSSLRPLPGSDGRFRRTHRVGYPEDKNKEEALVSLSSFKEKHPDLITINLSEFSIIYIHFII